MLLLLLVLLLLSRLRLMLRRRGWGGGCVVVTHGLHCLPLSLPLPASRGLGVGARIPPVVAPAVDDGGDGGGGGAGGRGGGPALVGLHGMLLLAGGASSGP